MNWPHDFINKIICGDCLDVMKEMPARVIDMIICSPPYWGLRDYGTGPGQLGLEPTPEMYIKHLTEIFNEVKRVLKKEGTLWLNMGDTYSANRTYQVGQSIAVDSIAHQGMEIPNGIQPKCLLMIPERLAWSLIQNGWILRNKNIWHKPNAMPSSVTDRFSNSWEYVFMFSKCQRYYFDLDAVREPHSAESIERAKRGTSPDHKYANEPKYGGGGGINKPKVSLKDKIKRLRISGQLSCGEDEEYLVNPLGKNPGDHWMITTTGFPEAHFAVFPEKLCEKPIKAGCPEGGIVLDPFCGAGTALLVAKEMRRRYIGIDINQEFCDICKRRLAQGVL